MTKRLRPPPDVHVDPRLEHPPPVVPELGLALGHVQDQPGERTGSQHSVHVRPTPRHPPPPPPPPRVGRSPPTSRGCSPSSFTLIGPPIATPASNPSSSGSGSPSSSSTRRMVAPRSRRTSSYAPGGSQAMCWRTRTRTMLRYRSNKAPSVPTRHS